MSSRAKRDLFYQLAKDCGFRARSAFKLLEMIYQHEILDNVKRVVDLCAAPGSWSQVVAEKFEELNLKNGKIIAVDVQEILALPNVITIEADISRQSTVNEVISHLDGNKADLVLCDGAPDITGLYDIDLHVQHHLILSALVITARILRKGGRFVVKIFRTKNSDEVIWQLQMMFKEVKIYKPSSSRTTSYESYAICDDFLDTFDRFNTRIRPEIFHTYEKKIILLYSTLTERYNSDTSYPINAKHVDFDNIDVRKTYDNVFRAFKTTIANKKDNYNNTKSCNNDKELTAPIGCNPLERKLFLSSDSKTFTCSHLDCAKIHFPFTSTYSPMPRKPPVLSYNFKEIMKQYNFSEKHNMDNDSDLDIDCDFFDRCLKME